MDVSRRELSKLVRVLLGGFVLLATVAVAAGCSSDDDDLALLDPSPTSVAASSASESTAGFAGTGSSEDGSPQAVALTARWQEFIIVGATQSNPDRLTEVATAEAAEAANAQFFDQRRVESFYTQVAIDGDTATIEECVLVDKPLSTFLFVPVTGTAELVDSQWTITRLDVASADRCIPGDLAAEVLKAYENYWDAEVAFRNPPDLNHPLLEQTTTGEHLTNTLELIEQQIDEDVAWRGRPTTHPEFFDYVSGEMVIDDCQQVDPETGIYDSVTGERTNLYPAIETDQKDGVRTRLENIDGQWKVAFVGADRNIDCQFAPTEFGIPVVGPLELS